MCGIAGFTGAGDLDDIHSMTEILYHRGPDNSGFWYDPDINTYFGHRRLSIIDLKDGSQPMSTADSELTVTYNGEIYNHSDLRTALERKGHHFVTNHSDTEILLHGYREWGERLPEKLNGMWAFAISDRKKKTIFLSRDRFGEKPLYYSFQNGTFAFASELHALTRHSRIEACVFEGGLKKYFAYGYIPAPSTIFKRIHKLPGGYNLTVDTNDLVYHIRRYWEFVLEPFDNLGPDQEGRWCEELRSLISDAVERRMIADVPLGVFLSGGIDSSSIAAFASKKCSQKLRTFSIGFDEESFDESRYSKKIADWLDTDHQCETLSLDRTKSLLPEIASRLDEPMGDSSLLPTYLLCRSTRKQVTVALGGDGADELFAGYDPFLALRKAEFYTRFVPKPIHKGIRMLAARLPVVHRNMSLDFKIKRTLRGLDYPKELWNSVWLGPLSPDELDELFNRPIDIEEVYSEAIEQWDACRQTNLIDKTLQFYTRLYLQDDILVKVDRASMMNSLEVRAPYLDIELVDFVRKIPSRYKFHNGQTKHILKKALETVLPRNVIYRPKKGFGIPIGQWLKDFFVFNIDSGDFFEYLNPSFTKIQLHEHKYNKADNRSFLWNMWLLEEWDKSRVKAGKGS